MPPPAASASTTAVGAARSASSCQVVRQALAPLSEALRAAPHRDAAHVPYGQWLRMYVQLLQTLRAHTAGGHRDLAAPAATLRDAKAAVNTALFSSVFATAWRQVQLPAEAAAALMAQDGARQESSGVQSVAGSSWYAPGADAAHCGSLSDSLRLAGSENSLHGAAHQPRGSSGSQYERVEVLTPKYLTEPLLGGAGVASWMNEFRRSAAASTRAEDAMAVAAQAPCVCLCIPFSTLLQLKLEAHLHTTPAALAGSHQQSRSLQDRQARLSLLLSLNQALQTSADLQQLTAPAGHGGPRGGPVAAPPRLQLRVWSPSQEFDALCALPRVRPQLRRPSSRGSRATPSTGAEEDASLSLAVLCEQLPARLAFLVRSAALQRTQSTASSLDTAPPVALLVHGSEGRRARALGVPLVRERSVLKDSLQLPASGVSAGRSAHDTAWRGCGDLIRRMTAREENLRQSLSQH